MRPSICAVIALAVLAPLAGCESSPTAPTGPIVLTLAPGQSDSANGLTLKFVGVTADTRCPADVFCVQAGDAFIKIETVWFGLRETAELQLADPAKRSMTRGNVKVEFEVLNPYPLQSRGPIAPGDYRARFRVTRV